MDLINHPYLRQKTWLKKNHDSCETYSTNCQIRIKTKMLKYIFVKGMMIITGIAAGTSARPADKKDKGVIILHHSLTA